MFHVLSSLSCARYILRTLLLPRCMVYVPSLAHSCSYSFTVFFHCLCAQKRAVARALSCWCSPVFAVSLSGSRSSCSSSSCGAGSSSCPEASFWPSLGHSLARLRAAAGGEFSVLSGRASTPRPVYYFRSRPGGGAAHRALVRALHAEGVVLG